MIHPFFITLLFGVLGVGFGTLLHFPAPFLTGPAVAVSTAALLGFRLEVPILVRHICFIAIGISMGAGVTPETVASIMRWPLSIVALSISLVIMFLGSARVLRRRFAYDDYTALLASSPGHLSYIIGLSADTKADIPTLSIVQSVRVLVITLIVPFAVTIFAPDAILNLVLAGSMSAFHVAILSVLALVVGLAFLRWHVPAAFMLAGLLVSSIGHLGEWTTGVSPDWLLLPAFATMGMLIGSRFSGVGWAKIKSALGASAAVTGLAAVLSVSFSAFTAWALGLPWVHVMVAFAPGGLESMAALAIVTGANPAYVAAHHVFRILFLTMLIPFLMQRLKHKSEMEQ